MRSLIGALVAKSPVSYSPRGLHFPQLQRNDAQAQMSAMGGVGTLFAIVNRTSNSTAQVEWKLWRKAASGKPEDRTEVTVHAAKTVWDKPNPFMTRQEFVETFQQHLDLTGEAWWTVGKVGKMPIELWPVRPDRMAPIPDAEKFIRNYEYTDPNGARVPLGTDEVVFLRMPNPLDIYRGMGPVQSMLTTLDSVQYSAEWNLNFFKNGAEPGGIVEVENRLSDDEFDEMTTRWREQHQGVNNAHRVAIIEQGKWVDRKFTNRDMQFVELNSVSRETIREAFGFPLSMLGTSQDVNRAAAEAGEYVFAKYLVVSRLERVKGALNEDFLPLFGKDAAKGLEFDYVNPVPKDEAQEDTKRVSVASATKTYIDLGFDPAEVLDMFELPALKYTKPDPKPTFRPPGDDKPAADEPIEQEPDNRFRRAMRNAAQDVDLTPVQDAWSQALDVLLEVWREDIQPAQFEALAAQVTTLVNAGDVAGLAAMTVPSDDAAAALLRAMQAMAAIAARQLAAEAAEQGVEDVAPMVPTLGTLGPIAVATAAMLAAELALSAGREALRVNSRNRPGEDVAAEVRTHLDALTDARPRKELGGRLTGAQNAARIETLRAAPSAALYANETLDRNTCGPCRKINGRWLGNSKNGTDLEQVEKLYPFSGYIDCEGGVQCRGTIVGAWRPLTTEGGD